MSSKFVLYVLDGCPFCKRATDKLEQLSLQHETVVVEQSQKEQYKIKHKMSTFPQIFFEDKEGKYKIGGCDELETILEIIKTIGEKFDIKVVEKILKIIEDKTQ